MSLLRVTVAAMCFATLVATAGEASGQAPIDPATRGSARQLGDEAGEDFAKGDYAAALDKYTRADKLIHLPTLSLRIARCLDKLGRLVEAAERYVDVTRMPVADDPRGLQAEAKQQAASEHAALLPRIPSVMV
jgi:hypothetical protein